MAFSERGPSGYREMYSGRMYEADLLGDFKPTKEFVAKLRAIRTETGYVERGKILDLIRRHPSEDPTNPGKPFAYELRLATAEAMGLEDDADLDRLKFYTAVGTPADVFHGIDAWIEFESKRGNDSVIVTLDATKNPNKEEAKADLVIPEIPDPSEDEDAFLKAAEKYGGMVARQLQEKIREKKNRMGSRMAA